MLCSAHQRITPFHEILPRFCASDRNLAHFSLPVYATRWQPMAVLQTIAKIPLISFRLDGSLRKPFTFSHDWRPVSIRPFF